MISTKIKEQQYEINDLDIANTLHESKKIDPSQKSDLAKINSSKQYLEIICFKMENHQVQTMDFLIKKKLYFSKSEILRTASRNLLRKINSPNTDVYLTDWKQGKNESLIPKDSISTKLPHILLKCIDDVDEALFPSRSQFMRSSIDLLLEDRKLLHNFFKENDSEEKKNKLKVIAFKLPDGQISNINSLVEEGFYPSLSETVRIAMIDFLLKILEFNSTMERDYWITPLDQKLLSKWESQTGDKTSACTKMPLELLEVIDTMLIENKTFGNRTNFIRLAVKRFLEEDSQIYSPSLNSLVKKYLSFH